jgi:hypothetical protein
MAEEFRAAMVQNPLIPTRFKKAPLTLASQEELWGELKAQKPVIIEDLESLRSRIQWASAFDAFKKMPWKSVLEDIADLRAQWDEIKISLPSREGLERFFRTGMKEPFLENKLKTMEGVQSFLEQAERSLFVYQYLADQRLQIPEEEPYVQEDLFEQVGVREGSGGRDYALLRQMREEILAFYSEAPSAFPNKEWGELYEKFKHFQENYKKVYVSAHHKARGGSQFEPYERLRQSKRYRLLKRLDQLEMISVEHNRRTIDQALSSVLLHRCLRTPQDDLQGQPVCSCGFRLGERSAFKPLREIERDMDLGIMETLEALQAPAVQERILPFLEGLDLVGKKTEANAIRELLNVRPRDEELIAGMDRFLTPQVVQNINEAFRGKVVVVKRDLDQLYQSLVHRKYTLTQLRKILKEWLREEKLAEDTFLHFVGGAENLPSDVNEKALEDLLSRQFPQLFPLYREIGHAQMVRVLITSFWADQYDISTGRIIEVFPYLERGGEKENARWVDALSQAGRDLCSQKPDVLDALASELEEDQGHVETLWSLLSKTSPLVIFQKESLFESVLTKAFSRILSSESVAIAPTTEEGSEKSSAEIRPRIGKQKTEMADVLKRSTLLKKKRARLRAPKKKDPASFPRWESLFIENISPLPSLSEGRHEKLKRMGIPIPPFLRQETKETEKEVHEISQYFKGFYHQALPIWEKGESPRPCMIQDIPSLLSRKRHLPEYKRVLYLLMDGMRWDLWESIKAGFFDKFSHLFRFVREGALWASQPTVTGLHLERLEAALCSAHPNDDRESVFWKISGIDEKIHTERGPLTHLFANVIGYLEIDLLFRLQNLPARTLLFLFSDHGFVENPAFDASAKYESPRYLHGKDSPFEVIVPWAWVMRL